MDLEINPNLGTLALLTSKDVLRNADIPLNYLDHTVQDMVMLAL